MVVLIVTVEVERVMTVTVEVLRIVIVVVEFVKTVEVLVEVIVIVTSAKDGRGAIETIPKTINAVRIRAMRFIDDSRFPLVVP